MVLKGEIFMNLTNLKSGDIIANYPKMCELLEEPEKRGSPRDRQIEVWKRYFNYEKQRHKFSILEVYTTPLPPKVDGRSNGNNAIYIEYTSSLLLNQLAFTAKIVLSRGNKFIERTDNQIKLILGLCNEDYAHKDDIFEELYLNSDLTKNDWRSFYNRANTKHSEIIKSTFKNIAKNHKWLVVTRVTKVIEDKKLRIATECEENIIAEVKRAVLLDYNVKTIFIIYAKNKQEEFYERVNQLLYQAHNWEASYKVNKISFNANMAIDYLNYELTDDEELEKMTKVNLTIKMFLDEQAANSLASQEKRLSECNNEDNKPKKVDANNSKKSFAPPFPMPTKREEFLFHEKYLVNQILLSDLLIKLK